MKMIVRTPALILTVLAWGCTDTSVAIDGGSIDARTDGGSTDAPTDAPAGVDFFDGTGMYNAAPFTVHCTPGPGGALIVASLMGPGVVQIACSVGTPNVTVDVSAFGPTLGPHSLCSPAPGGILVHVDGHSPSNTAGVNCDDQPATFSVNVTEFTHNPDGSVTWAATFAMTGHRAADSASASATGSFRVTAHR